MKDFEELRLEAGYRSMEEEEQRKKQREERKSYLKNCLSPYKKIAIEALINWNGLSREEATKIARESTNEELENQVYAKSSIEYILEGFEKYRENSPEILKINDEDIANLRRIVMQGLTIDDDYSLERIKFKLCLQSSGRKEKEIIKNARENQEEIDWQAVYAASNRKTHEFILFLLSNIHDGWVKDNQKKFMARDKKYQHMPIELIGWKEAKADLLFLEPILSTMNIGFDEEILEEEYYEMAKAFLQKRGIVDVRTLQEQISKGAKFYPALEGQEDIIQALQDPEFVEEQVISGIRDKGIGTNEQFLQQIFSEKASENTQELEDLRDQKEQLEREAELISETEKLITERDGQDQNPDLDS